MAVDPYSNGQNLNETFVFKLYRMVEDEACNHLIGWNHDGSTFVVSNAMDFARDVLPKYFKHNNFSSYVRQLNMYGFHKINELPRSSRGTQESQVWEFSHPKFVRGRTDLLNDIKRRVVSSTSSTQGSSPGTGTKTSQEFEEGLGKKDKDEIMGHLAASKAAQSEMSQTLHELQTNFHVLWRELSEAKRKQHIYQEGAKRMIEVLNKHHHIIYQGTAKPFELQDFGFHELENKPHDPSAPIIYVSNSDYPLQLKPEVESYSDLHPTIGSHTYAYPQAGHHHQQGMHHQQQQQFVQAQPQSHSHVPSIYHHSQSSFYQFQQQGPKLSVPNPNHQRSRSYNTAINTPLPPSPIGSPGYNSPITDTEDDFMDPASPEERSWGY